MEFVTKIVNQKEVFEVYLMDTLNKDEQNSFLQSFYKSFGARNSLDINWFDWHYNKNPFGACNNYLLLNTPKDVVGAFGYTKNISLINGWEIQGVIGINGFINPGYTARGLYTELMIKTLTHIQSTYKIGFSFPHGINKGSIKGHINSKWELNKKLDFLKKELSPNKIGKLDTIVYNFDINALKEFDFDQKQSLIVKKSVDWIKWRFYDRPDKSYGCITLQNDSAINSYIIFTVYEDKNARRCQVADYEYEGKENFVKLLQKLETWAQDNSCITCEFLVNKDNKDTFLLTEQEYKMNEEHYLMFVYGDVDIPNDIKSVYGYFDVV